MSMPTDAGRALIESRMPTLFWCDGSWAPADAAGRCPYCGRLAGAVRNPDPARFGRVREPHLLRVRRVVDVPLPGPDKAVGWTAPSGRS